MQSGGWIGNGFNLLIFTECRIKITLQKHKINQIGQKLIFLDQKFEIMSLKKNISNLKPSIFSSALYMIIICKMKAKKSYTKSFPNLKVYHNNWYKCVWIWIWEEYSLRISVLHYQRSYMSAISTINHTSLDSSQSAFSNDKH